MTPDPVSTTSLALSPVSSAQAERAGNVREPTRSTGSSRGDRMFEAATTVLAAGAVLTLAALLILLIVGGWPALNRFGLSFFMTTTWDPVHERFGAAHLVYGTLVTSLIALLLATPLGVGAALYIAEYAPEWLREPVSIVVELLAVIPSIIYGLWGYFVLAPVMRRVIEPALKGLFGDVPILGGLFQGATIGRDLLTAGVILAIMILPTVMAISREVFRAVPDTQREGMLALGATKWEAIRDAVLPYARAGLVGAAMLGLARALGETMAVTMLIGNSSSRINGSLLTPGYTMASAIANQFGEADGEVYFSAIVAVALTLLLVSSVVQLLSRLFVWRFVRGVGHEIAA
jgi:phosphate transport system permease protein